MSYTYDENIVADLHKDARGYRPRELWWGMWSEASEDEKQSIWDSLCDELSEEIDRERKAQEKSITDLQERIQETISLGAGDEVTAIKWIMEAENFSEYDLMYGPSYFCYHFGIPYSSENNIPSISQAINEMLPKAA